MARILISFYFLGISRINFGGGIVPDPHQGFVLDPLRGLQHPTDTHLYTKVLHAVVSAHLNNQSIKKSCFDHCNRCSEIYRCCGFCQ